MTDYSNEVLPLSKEEKAWLRKLEKVLMACPPRIVLQTIGDPCLEAVDKYIQEKYDIETCDGGAQSSGICLGEIRSACQIWGVSG